MATFTYNRDHYPHTLTCFEVVARMPLLLFHFHITLCLDHKRSSSGLKNLTPDLGGVTPGGQGGYSTNFSGGLSGGAESQVITAVFKVLITRFVEASKELRSQENLALYCDIRQLVTYVKGAHGGPFRRVALSGILAVTPRPHKKVPCMQTTRVIRY